MWCDAANPLVKALLFPHYSQIIPVKNTAGKI